VEGLEKKFDDVIIGVTPENVGVLMELRSIIDGVKDTNKLRNEAESYSQGRNNKALISKLGEIPAGFVEAKLESDDLPGDAPRIEGLNGLAELSRIGVIEEYRGKGIATKLISAIEEWARQNGKKGMWLDYLASNEAASRLYARTGYTDVAQFLDNKKNKTRRIATKYF